MQAAARARSLRLWRTPRQLPASAFDQHYDGNAAGAANLSGLLLEHLSRVLTRSADTASTAYELSVPLLAASVLGPAVHNVTPSRATVPALSERMADALAAEHEVGSTPASVRCWLVGRLLLAATAQGDSAMEYGHGHSTETLLHELDALGANDDCYSCWAWSYLVQARHQANECALGATCSEYGGGGDGSDARGVRIDTHPPDMSVIEQQWWRRQLPPRVAPSAACAGASRRAPEHGGRVLVRSVDADAHLEHTQWAHAAGSSRGDVMWSAVCAASAAASLRDEAAFTAACESIMHVGNNMPPRDNGHRTLPQCISQCIPPQDFRAWAISLLYVAASQIEIEIEAGPAQNDEFAAAAAPACGATPHALVAASPHPAERLLALGNFWLADYTRWVATAAARPAGADSGRREQERTFKVTVPDAAASLDALRASC